MKFQKCKNQEEKKFWNFSEEKYSLPKHEWKLNLLEASHEQHWKLEINDALPSKFFRKMTLKENTMSS